jgi:exodeoxyribonuclease V gamma subunit
MVEVSAISQWTRTLKTLIWPLSPPEVSLSRLTWAILEVGPEVARQRKNPQGLEVLFGRSTVLAGRRFAVAQQLAKVLQRLLTHRSEWIEQWSRGDNVLPLQCTAPWWPALWRAVKDALKGYTNEQLLTELCQRVTERPELIKHRFRQLIFFGHHRYDSQTLALAQALSQVLDVTFISVDPSASRMLLSASSRQRGAPRSPLLQSAGAGFCAHFDRRYIDDPLGDSTVDRSTQRGSHLPKPPHPLTLPPPKPLHTASSSWHLKTASSESAVTQSAAPSNTLLGALQEATAWDRGHPQAPEVSIQETRSLRFHHCSSEQRQVEALYQTLCASFRRDPTLRPRDVLVLCPEIERFVPLITAVFNGAIEETHSSSSLSIVYESGGADQPPSRLGAEISRPHGLNPFSDLLTQLMSLSTGRVYRYDVLQLLKLPLVSQRFHLTLEEILKVDTWLKRSGVRWGLDEAHRVECGLNEEAQHTWQFGLDRLLLGALVGDDFTVFRGASPVTVGSGEPALIKFFDFFVVFKELILELKHPLSPKMWAHRLVRSVRCLTRPQGEGRWLQQELEADLMHALGQGAPQETLLSPQAVTRLLESGLGRKRMLIGGGRDHVRFYPLDQAFSLPAKVLCVLDMTEGRFPRRYRPDRFDPISLDPRPTDLHPTHEQSANLISSLLSAQREAHFFYTGRQPSGETRAPAPIILSIQEELKARISLQLTPETPPLVGVALIDALKTEHSLHSFSPKNFRAVTEGVPLDETLSHDPMWLRGARVWQEAMRDPSPRPPFSEGGVEDPARGVRRMRLDTLQQMLKNPSEFFLKRGVGVHLLKDDQVNRERELLDLDALQSWGLKQRTLDLFFELEEETLSAQEGAHDLGRSIFETVRAEGLLPVGGMGQVSFEQAFDEIHVLFQRFREVRQGAKRTPLNLSIKLPSGRPLRVEGQDVFDKKLIMATPSRHVGKDAYRGKRLLNPWLYHVALCASERPYDGATLVCADGNFNTFPPIESGEAKRLLDDWVSCLERGVHHPLRFDPDLSWTYLQRRREGGIEEIISSEWESEFGPKRDLYIQQAFDHQPMWRAGEELIHPDFQQAAELIFGPLEESLHQAQLAEESGGDLPLPFPPIEGDPSNE